MYIHIYIYIYIHTYVHTHILQHIIIMIIIIIISIFIGIITLSQFSIMLTIGINLYISSALLTASRRGQDRTGSSQSAAIPPSELSWGNVNKIATTYGNMWQSIATCDNIWQNAAALSAGSAADQLLCLTASI